MSGKIVKRKPHEVVEGVFDLMYLFITVFSGIYFLFHRQQHTALFLYGIMTLILGIGDAFHLLPRVFVIISHNKKGWQKPLGVGKLITSITMTIMYLLLFAIWYLLYPQLMKAEMVTLIWYVALVFAVVRIVLCILPGNRWVQGDGKQMWAILRNIPFFIMGIMIVILFSISGSNGQDGFQLMNIAVLFSFIFYVPVVLFGKKYPMIGALMLPKTVMYLWMVLMGFSLI